MESPSRLGLVLFSVPLWHDGFNKSAKNTALGSSHLFSTACLLPGKKKISSFTIHPHYNIIMSTSLTKSASSLSRLTLIINSIYFKAFSLLIIIPPFLLTTHSIKLSMRKERIFMYKTIIKHIIPLLVSSFSQPIFLPVCIFISSQFTKVNKYDTWLLFRGSNEVLLWLCIVTSFSRGSTKAYF